MSVLDARRCNVSQTVANAILEAAATTPAVRVHLDAEVGAVCAVREGGRLPSLPPSLPGTPERSGRGERHVIAGSAASLPSRIPVARPLNSVARLAEDGRPAEWQSEKGEKGEKEGMISPWATDDDHDA